MRPVVPFPKPFFLTAQWLVFRWSSTIPASWLCEILCPFLWSCIMPPLPALIAQACLFFQLSCVFLPWAHQVSNDRSSFRLEESWIFQLQFKVPRFCPSYGHFPTVGFGFKHEDGCFHCRHPLFPAPVFGSCCWSVWSTLNWALPFPSPLPFFPGPLLQSLSSIDLLSCRYRYWWGYRILTLTSCTPLPALPSFSPAVGTFLPFCRWFHCWSRIR